MTDVGRAAEQLLAACSSAVCIRIEDESLDALATGVAAIGRIYDRAARPRRRKRS